MEVVDAIGADLLGTMLTKEVLPLYDTWVRIRKRQIQGEGGMAMMLAKRQKPGKWVVTKFGKKHNHPMVVNSNKEQPTPDEEDKKIQELSVELNRANIEGG
ncbi:hypothetical protein IFM89_005810 [Coptis chinensis]|uniref:FAR1 domain-containing protein n=1 Tax=Coptis chinensis TaxID=261450 RepID=A0A835MD07_9MAGN|nr:hypothetical protein IFM89_005810 [Coptis chinensis]